MPFLFFFVMIYAIRSICIDLPVCELEQNVVDYIAVVSNICARIAFSMLAKRLSWNRLSKIACFVLI